MPSYTPSPCRDCRPEDKYIGCHADCEKYIEYTIRQKEIKTKVEHSNMVNSMHVENCKEVQRRKMKKRRK